MRCECEVHICCWIWEMLRKGICRKDSLLFFFCTTARPLCCGYHVRMQNCIALIMFPTTQTDTNAPHIYFVVKNIKYYVLVARPNVYSYIGELKAIVPQQHQHNNMPTYGWNGGGALGMFVFHYRLQYRNRGAIVRGNPMHHIPE